MSNPTQKSNRRPSIIAQKFSKTDLEKIWGQGGKSFASLGKQLQVCPKALKHQMIEYGIIPYRIPEEHQHLTKELLEQEYQTSDIKQMAKKFKVSASTINLLFDHFGVERKHIVYSINEGFFDLDSPETFYVAGLWAADGCVTQPTQGIQPTRIHLGLKASDKEHLVKVQKLLAHTGPLYYGDKEHPSYALEIGSVRMVNSLKRFGIGPRKSLTYQMPEWLVNHPLVNYFLLGVFDGDGGWYLRKSGYDCGIGIRATVEFLQQLHGILYKNGIVANETKIIKISSGIGGSNYGGIPNCYRIYRFFHQDSKIHLDRKYRQFQIVEAKYLQDLAIQNAAEQRNVGILEDFDLGLSMQEIGLKHSMHPTSVANLIREVRGSIKR